MIKKIFINGGLTIVVYILFVFIFKTQRIIFPIFMIVAFFVSMRMLYKDVIASLLPLLIIWFIHLFLPDTKINNVIIYVVFTPLTFLLGYYLRNKLLLIKILYPILLVLIGLFGFKNLWFFLENINARKPQNVPKMELLSNGNQIRLDTINNKIIVLDYWTTNCGVCFKKFPEYEKLYLKYIKNPNVLTYAVNIPSKNDTIGYAKKMIEKYNYKFPVLYSDSDTIPKQLGFNKYPHLVIIKNKKIRFNGYPALEEDYLFVSSLEDEIERLLNE
ncbi:TlpA family protein disulfide reductase [Polaribacter porphyrae]|nr:TlpA disulfide reductase family protein [Polaribacter porphyrae]